VSTVSLPSPRPTRIDGRLKARVRVKVKVKVMPKERGLEARELRADRVGRLSGESAAVMEPVMWRVTISKRREDPTVMANG